MRPANSPVAGSCPNTGPGVETSDPWAAPPDACEPAARGERGNGSLPREGEGNGAPPKGSSPAGGSPEPEWRKRSFHRPRIEGYFPTGTKFGPTAVRKGTRMKRKAI